MRRVFPRSGLRNLGTSEFLGTFVLILFGDGVVAMEEPEAVGVEARGRTVEEEPTRSSDEDEDL